MLISALRDATKYISERIEATEVGDVSDLEEYLIPLSNLGAEVREHYERLAESDPQVIAYEQLWPLDD